MKLRVKMDEDRTLDAGNGIEPGERDPNRTRAELAVVPGRRAGSEG